MADVLAVTGRLPSMDTAMDLFFTEDKMSVASNELQATLESRTAQLLTACGVSPERFRVSGQRARGNEPSGVLLLSPLLRLTDRAQKLRQFAVETGPHQTFPTELANQDPHGPHQLRLKSDIDAVAAAAAELQRRPLVHPREVPHRSFLERHAHDATQLKKLIMAMLTSEPACGGSETLLAARPKCLTFFDPKTLPDPTHMGYHHLEKDDWENKFESSLRRFYHHVSEKHCGEFVQIVRQSAFPSECEHPATQIYSDCQHWHLIPEVHSSQFLSDDAPPEVLQRAISMFKDKWWREDVQGAEQCRTDFIEFMRQHPNRIWKPIPGSTKSYADVITWHSLESLVWNYVTSPAPEDITFADLYLFFCRCPLLTVKRTHSTAGKGAAERSHQKAKGKGKAAW